MEEDVLCLFLATEELHVVDDQHIHHLVEVAEVVDGVVPNGVDELVREALRTHVEHRLVRLLVLDLQPNGVGEMRFAQTHTSVDQEGIEGCSARFVGHGETCAPRKTVAFTFDEAVERVVGIQVGVDVQLAQTWNHKRILDGGGLSHNRHGHFCVPSGTHFSGGNVDRVGAAGDPFAGVLHDDAVFQTSLRAKLFAHSFAQQRNVVLFKPLVEKLGGNLNGEHISIELHRLDRRKPSLVRLIVDVVLDDSQALGPNAGVVLVHAERLKRFNWLVFKLS